MPDEVGVTDVGFQREWKRLTVNYLSAADAETVTEKRALYADVLRLMGWVTDPVLRRAVTRMLLEVPGYLPTAAEFKGELVLANDALKREEQRERLKLPAPPSTEVGIGQYGYGRFTAGIAAGKAHARKRQGVIDAYRKERGLAVHHAIPEDVWRGLDIPTEQEIRNVVLEMFARQDRLCKGTQEEALAAVPEVARRLAPPEPEPEPPQPVGAEAAGAWPA